MTTKPHIPIEMIEPERQARVCCNNDCSQGKTCPARMKPASNLQVLMITLAGFWALVGVLMILYGFAK